jgi:hypothetical protein
VDRARTLFVFLLAFLISAQAEGLAAVDGISQAPAPLNGAYIVHLNVHAGSTLESGGTVACRAWIRSSRDGGRASTVASPVRGGRGAVGFTATAATCVVEIPFSWAGKEASRGIVWSYEVEVVPAAGSRQASRVVSQRDIPMVLPQPGVVSMSFDVVF